MVHATTDLGVAVLARTPGSGGKTRLAATWGRRQTDTFYTLCLHCAREWLSQAQQTCTGYWALTGPGSRQEPFWQDVEVLEQPEGSLGTRMAGIASQLMVRHGCWCLVGTDIPQMNSLTELNLTSALAANDYVFAPSSDGGFWLAAGRCLPSRDTWNNVVYSQPDTLVQLIAELKREVCGTTIHTLSQTLTDVDHQHDLFTLVNELSNSTVPLHRCQQQLLTWLKDELSICYLNPGNE